MLNARSGRGAWKILCVISEASYFCALHTLGEESAKKPGFSEKGQNTSLVNLYNEVIGSAKYNCSLHLWMC